MVELDLAEGEPEEDDFRFFGYVCCHDEEWGYFVLSELESVRGPAGLSKRLVNYPFAGGWR